MEKENTILVNGEPIGEGLIAQELKILHERYAREMSFQELEENKAKIESDARENAVERILLTQQARSKIDNVRPEEIDARFIALKQQYGGDEEFAKHFALKDEDVVKIKADIEDDIRLEKHFDELCKDAKRPGEADARAYYMEHVEEFKVPEMVHAAHIVQHLSPGIEMEKIYAELLNIREQLMAGASFDALAQEYSHCRDGSHDLGYFARGQMVQAFENVAFDTKVGEYSDVFRTEFGYHVLTVLDRKEESVREFVDVRYDIESMLFDQRKNAVIGAEADRLRAEADIQNLGVVER